MKRRVAGTAILLAGLGLLGAGCATGRLADLKDCGALSLGVGAGLDATVKAGCLLQPGVGLIGSKTARVGHESRARSGAWEEEQFVWPVEWFRRGIAQPQDDAREQVALAASYTRTRAPKAEGDPAEEACLFPVLAGRAARDPFSFHELTDLQVGATAGVVALRVGVNPLEILDFLLGFLGFDIAGDDPKD